VHCANISSYNWYDSPCCTYCNPYLCCTSNTLHKWSIPQVVYRTSGALHEWWIAKIVHQTISALQKWCIRQLVHCTSGASRKWCITSGTSHKWCIAQVVHHTSGASDKWCISQVENCTCCAYAHIALFYDQSILKMWQLWLKNNSTIKIYWMQTLHLCHIYFCKQVWLGGSMWENKRRSLVRSPQKSQCQHDNFKSWDHINNNSFS